MNAANAKLNDVDEDSPKTPDDITKSTERISDEMEISEPDRDETKNKLNKTVRYSDELFEMPPSEELATSVKLKSCMKSNSKEYYENLEKVDEKPLENGTSTVITETNDQGGTSTVIAETNDQGIVQKDVEDVAQEIDQNEVEEIGEQKDDEAINVQNDDNTNCIISGTKIVGSVNKLRDNLNKDEQKISHTAKLTETATHGFKNDKPCQRNHNFDKIKSLQDIRSRMRSDRSDSGFSESSVGKTDQVTVEPTQSKVQALSNRFKNKESNEANKMRLRNENEKNRKVNKVDGLSKKTEIFESLKQKQDDKTKKYTNPIQTKTETSKKRDINIRDQKVDQLSKTTRSRDQSPSRLNLDNSMRNQKLDQLSKTVRDQSPSRICLRNQKMDQIGKTCRSRDQSPSRLNIESSMRNQKVEHLSKISTTRDLSPSRIRKQQVDEIRKTGASRDQSPSRINAKLKQFQSNVKTSSTDLKLNNKNNVITKNKVQENPFIKQQNQTDPKPLVNKIKTQTSIENTKVKTPPRSPTIKSDSSNKFFTTRKQTPQMNKTNISPQNSKTNMTINTTLNIIDKKSKDSTKLIDDVTDLPQTAEIFHKNAEQKSTSIFSRVHSKISTDLLGKFEQSQGNDDAKLALGVAGSQSKDVKSSFKVTTNDQTIRSSVPSNRETNLTRVSNNSVESKLITANVFTKQVINNNNSDLTNNNLSCLDKTINSLSTTQEHGLVEQSFKFKRSFASKESATGTTTEIHNSSFQNKMAFWNR